MPKKQKRKIQDGKYEIKPLPKLPRWAIAIVKQAIGFGSAGKLSVEFADLAYYADVTGRGRLAATYAAMANVLAGKPIGVIHFYEYQS